ncbi:MAG: prepilin-type N-terminal cleavage/methylation domain-containing protein [Planctomycetaceae bacterium]|nr:MAG: prepilin-type N-terminal cleavage/methylation domain-containing protein [Planctomycetaceae bacterium]
MVHRVKINRRFAFTLVEILAVVVILAVSAAVVIPKAVGTSDMQAQAAARMLAADLEYARDLSITMAKPTTVTFNVTGNSYVLTNASGNIIHPITKLPAYAVNFTTQSGFGQVKLSSASFNGGSSFTFDETGAPDKDGYVTLQAGTHSYKITVSPATGKVSVTGS